METTRDEYRDKIEAQLKQWSSRLGMLQAKAEKAGADTKRALLDELEELKKLEEAGRVQLAALESAAAATWNEVKSELNDKWNLVSGAFDAIWARVPWNDSETPAAPTPPTTIQ